MKSLKKTFIFAILLTIASHFGAKDTKVAINTEWDDYLIDQFYVIEDVENV